MIQHFLMFLSYHLILQGKDRYPYPVGYKSMRTQNAITYMMEILEGLKGPSFTVSKHQTSMLLHAPFGGLHYQ